MPFHHVAQITLCASVLLLLGCQQKRGQETELNLIEDSEQLDTPALIYDQIRYARKLAVRPLLLDNTTDIAVLRIGEFEFQVLERSNDLHRFGFDHFESAIAGIETNQISCLCGPEHGEIYALYDQGKTHTGWMFVSQNHNSIELVNLAGEVQELHRFQKVLNADAITAEIVNTCDLSDLIAVLMSEK